MLICSPKLRETKWFHGGKGSVWNSPLHVHCPGWVGGGSHPLLWLAIIKRSTLSHFRMKVADSNLPNAGQLLSSERSVGLDSILENHEHSCSVNKESGRWKIKKNCKTSKKLTESNVTGLIQMECLSEHENYCSTNENHFEKGRCSPRWKRVCYHGIFRYLQPTHYGDVVEKIWAFLHRE